MAHAKILRIVVVSPNDVQQECDVLDNVVTEVNRGVAADRGIRLEMARWETDAYPDFHPERAEGLIDPVLRITDCDLLIGIFWKRLGTPTSNAESGAEREIHIAYEAWKRSGAPQIMIYFNERSAAPKSSVEADQWAHVLRFKESFPKEGLWWAFRGHTQFEKLIRNHLAQFVCDRFSLLEDAAGQGTSAGAVGRFPPATAVHPAPKGSMPGGRPLTSDQLPTVGMVDLGARPRLFPVEGVGAENDLANRLPLAQLADWVADLERNVNLLFISRGQAEQIKRQQLFERMRDQLKVAYGRLREESTGVIAAKLYGESLYWLDDWKSAEEVFLDGWSLMGGLVAHDIQPVIAEDEMGVDTLRLAEFLATRIGLCRSKRGQGRQALGWYEVAFAVGERRLRHLRVALELASSTSRQNVREQVSDAEFLLHETENHKGNTLGNELDDFREASVFFTKALARLRQLQTEDPAWRPLDVIMQVANLSGLLAFALARQPTEVIEQVLQGLPARFRPQIIGRTAASTAPSAFDIARPGSKSAEDPVLELVGQGEDAFHRWEDYSGESAPLSHPRRANLARAKAARLLAMNRSYEARKVLDNSLAAAKGFRRGLLLMLRAEAETNTDNDRVKVCTYLSEAITLLNSLPTEGTRAKRMSLLFGCKP